jgi:biopolymer transport protein ExbB
MNTIAGRSVISILTGEWPMWILMALSVFAITLIVERFIYFRRNRFEVGKGFTRFRELVAAGNIDELKRYAQGQVNPMGRLFGMLANNLHLTGDELSDLAYSAILDEKLLFERFLGGIGTMANVATLVGLLGTVWGLILAFNKVYTAAGSGGAKVVAGGIAVALLATLVGLFVGILSLAFFNYYNKKASDQASRLESLMEKTVVFLERLKMKGQATMAAPAAKPEPKPAPKVEKNEEEAVWRF